MKGIILAGGTGSRLFPTTISTSKQLIPIYDKPLIYYPLSVLMLAGIREILIISSPKDIPRFIDLLGDGAHFGINITYTEQIKPNGIAEAFILGKEFIGNDSVALILGDNFFFGYGFSEILKNSIKDLNTGATIFGYYVKDPERFGIVEFDANHKPISIEEKPERPKSNYAIVGLYFYDNNVVKISENIKPSPRGELEISDVNKKYLSNEELSLRILGRGFTWLDTGNPDSLLDASHFVKTIQERQGLQIACLEEIAFKNKWIGNKVLEQAISRMSGTAYGEYLITLIND